MIDTRRFVGLFPAGDRQVGDFSWGDESTDGTRTLYIVLPGCKNPDALKCFKGTDRGIPREWGWDGNEDKPTLTPSILDAQTGWHGYLRAGKLMV